MQPVASPSPVKIVRNNEEGDKEKEERKMKINREMDEMKGGKRQQETKPLQGAESTFHIEIRENIQRTRKSVGPESLE